MKEVTPTQSTESAIDYAAEFKTLREGKSILAVDDHPNSLKMVEFMLNDSFSGKIQTETDPQKALETIVQSEFGTKPDVLILDMDMPGMTGREFLLKLAQEHHIFIPTVILSGGQGTGEIRKLLASISKAVTKQQLETIVDNTLERTGGLALTYLPKEDAALHPELLVQAIDVMLLAGRRQISNLELLLGSEQSSKLVCEDETLAQDRKQLLSELADMFLFHISRITELKNAFVEKQKALKDVSEKDANELKDFCSLLTFNPYDFNYDMLDALVTNIKFYATAMHTFRGSRGIAGIVGSRKLIYPKLHWKPDEEKEFDAKLMSYMQDALRDCWNFDCTISSFFEKGFCLSLLFKSLYYSCSSNKEDYLTVKGNAIDDIIYGNVTPLKFAIEQAVTNAKQAVAKQDDKKITIEYGTQCISEMDPKVQEHFTACGHPSDEKIALVTVSDNGPGIDPEIVQKWEQRETVISTKTGLPGTGLSLMRELIESSNDGMVTIASSPDGTVVQFVFGVGKEEESISFSGSLTDDEINAKLDEIGFQKKYSQRIASVNPE